jgi:protocatechuate 3,4-dioxygenase beta subunit
VAPAATPPCNGGQRLTPSRDEGPFFKPGSPERTSLLEADTAGARFALSGAVLSIACKPVAGAVLDFWQADDAGAHDNSGYGLRGQLTTGTDGRYQLQTIVPGVEAGRARHIHVKVQAPEQAPLTTQLYFAGDASNAGDGNFADALAIAVEQSGDARAAGFDFVLDVP